MNWKRYDDMINPVTVKELRQVSHGWGLPILQIMSLVLLFFTVSLFLLYPNVLFLEIASLAFDVSQNVSNGGNLCVIAVLDICLCSVALGGLGGMFRYSLERENKEMDIGNFTPLSPMRLVWGRLWGALTVFGYFLFWGLPCLVVAYHWGGIPLERAGRFLSLALVVSLVLIQLLLAVGARGNRIASFGILGALFFFGFPFMLLSLFLFFTSLASGPIWSIECVLGLMIFFLLIAENVGYLTAHHANRYCGFRKLAAAFSVLEVVMLFGWCQYPDKPVGQECVWACYIAYLILSVGCIGFSTLMGADQAGLRLREDCPESCVGRFWRFLFANVWGGSLVLCWLVLLIGLVAIKLSWKEFLVDDQHNGDLQLLNLFGYVVFYLELTQFIRLLWPKLTSVKTGLLVVSLCNGIPALVMFWGMLASGSDRFSKLDFAQLWNVAMVPSMFYGFDCTRQAPEGIRVCLGLVLAVVGLVLLLPAMVRQFRGFRRTSQEEWHQLFTPQLSERREHKG